MRYSYSGAQPGKHIRLPKCVAAATVTRNKKKYGITLSVTLHLHQPALNIYTIDATVNTVQDSRSFARSHLITCLIKRNERVKRRMMLAFSLIETNRLAYAGINDFSESVIVIRIDTMPITCLIITAPERRVHRVVIRCEDELKDEWNMKTTWNPISQRYMETWTHPETSALPYHP